MVASEVVTVYSFRIFEGHPELPRVAPYKATLSAIQRTPGAQVIAGTDELVEVGELDAAGRFQRLPTGWGELS